MSFPLLGQSGGAELAAAQADIVALQNDVATKAEEEALNTSISFVTATLNAGLAQKQDTIGPNDLAIGDTALLSSELASKALQADLTSGLAGKQDTLGATLQASTLQFADIDGFGINTMLLQGGTSGITCRDSANNPLLDLDSTSVICTPTLNASGGIVSSTINTINSRLNALENKPYIDCFANADSATFTNQTRVVPLNTIRTSTTGQFTIQAGGNLRFLVSGRFLVIYRLSTDIASGISRTVARGQLQRSNNNGAFGNIVGSNVFCYNRDATQGENTACSSCVIDITAQDRLRIVAIRHSGNDTLRTIANACGITAIAL